MKSGGGRHVLGVLVTLVVLLVVFVALVLGTRSVKGLGYEPAAVAATTGPSISLATFPDSYACHGSNGGPGGGAHPEWVTYCPSTTHQGPRVQHDHGDDQAVRLRAAPCTTRSSHTSKAPSATSCWSTANHEPK